MLMVLILCLQYKLGELFMTIAVLTVNVVGFALGSGLASLLSLLPISALVIHPLSTFLIPECPTDLYVSRGRAESFLKWLG